MERQESDRASRLSAGGRYHRLVNRPASIVTTSRIAHNTIAIPTEATPGRLQSGLLTLAPRASVLPPIPSSAAHEPAEGNAPRALPRAAVAPGGATAARGSARGALPSAVSCAALEGIGGRTDARGASVSNPLWSRPGVASVGIAIVLWAILLAVTIEAGRLTSLW